MTGDTVFLSVLAALSLLFAIFNVTCFILKRNKTAQTTGTIISLRSPNPESAKARNSKWARVSYKANGKAYTSQNRVQVPMTAQIGSPVTVRYDMEHPETLYSFSAVRIIASLCICVICTIIAACLYLNA